jgi:diguanylate cyclase (GGDEF)-like protein
MRLRTGRQVLVATLVITAISVASPVGVFAVVLISTHTPWMVTMFVLAICAAIPLLIAPPISIFALSMLRLLTLTIEKVDAYARLDSLTGVSTRASFIGQVRELLPQGGSFLMADADHFKAINDTFGHDVGDDALRVIAEAISRHTPFDAVVGRLGGEEFGIFLPGADADAAVHMAGVICETIRRTPLLIAGQEIRLTVSVGCAAHVPANTLEKTMKLADVALYRAKEAGRDGVYLADAAETAPIPAVRTSIH